MALVPLLYVLGRTSEPWQSAVVGLVYGVVFFGLFFYYISQYGMLPLVLLALFQGLFFGMLGWLAGYVRAVGSPLLRAAALAAAWTVIEYIRSHLGPLALNFGDVAYTQYQMLSVLQIASVLGSGAVTLMVVLVNALLASVLWEAQSYRSGARAIRRPAVAKPVAAGFAVVFAVMLGGSVAVQAGWFASPKIKTIAAGKPLVTIAVQGNLPVHHPVTEADADRSRLVYTYLTSVIPKSAVPDLVVWPETAIPVVLNKSPKYLADVQKSARETGGYLLMGALEAGSGGKVYNSAYFFSGEGKLLDTYRKVDLVAFGEYVPDLGPLNSLVSRYPVRSQNINPGGERNLLQAYEVPFGTLICWEAIFSGPNRQLCRGGAQFLAHLTSDSWAAFTPELRQHGAIAVLRAVESRRYVVRAATLGPSAIIDPYGHRIPLAEVGQGDIIQGKIYPLTGLSLYHRIGDLPLLGICMILWIVAMFLRRRRKTAL
ncbi:MAG: apolipoprotein N-acyltransferase [Candidatus Bathyarchaeota archaeon]